VSYEYLFLDEIDPVIPAMEARGVSEVARSGRGFLTAYRRAGGDAERLSPTWRAKRDGFVRRHMAQVRKNKERLWEDDPERKGKRPTRRHLALIAWAYTPHPTRYFEYLAKLED